MPVKSLETLFFERGLARSLPIHILKDSRLGIDVNHYLSRLLSFKKETNLDAIGGFPHSLKLYIESDLQVFKEYNITPIFVFSGNNIVEQFNIKNSRDILPAEKRRTTAWKLYADHLASIPKTILPTAPTEGFREYYTQFNADSILKDLVDYFIESGLEFIRAPYLSWVQLAYLYEVDYIDAIYGPTETVLLPNIDKFILGMEFTNKEFRYIDKAKVLHEFNINSERLLDIAVSVGCDLQPQTLPIYSPFNPNQLFMIGLDIVNSGGNIYASILSLNDEAHTKKFQKGIIALQFMPVLKLNGRVELQNYDGDDDKAFLDPENSPPTDLHNIVGQRLPHEYYFYQSIGLIDTKVLEAIIFGTYFERLPLDTAITTQYINTVKATVNIFKNKEINLLTQNMARYYQVKKIKFQRSFDKTDIELTNRLTTPVYFDINSLVIRSKERSFSLDLFLKSLKNDDLIGESAYKLDDESLKLQSNHEIIATSLLRTFFLLGFFEIDKETKKIKQNKWTKTFYQLTDLDSKFQEQYLLVLIFFKLDTFNIQEDLSENLVGASKTTDLTKRQIVQLISRLATFLNVEQKTQFYSGPISRSLLNFRSSIDLIKVNTSELIDSVLVNSLANNEVSKIDKSTADWKSLVKEIPFRKVTPNTVLGISLGLMLDLYYKGEETDEQLQKAKNEVLEHFNNPTSSLINLSNDTNTGFQFVTEVYHIAKSLHSEGLIKEPVFDIFTKANDLSIKILKI